MHIPRLSLRLNSIKRDTVLKVILVLFIAGTVSLILFVIMTRELAYWAASLHTRVAEHAEKVEPFPVGVNPLLETITEHPDVETYLSEHIYENPLARQTKSNWFQHLLARLAKIEVYQNLASPSTKILVIYAGQRKEEVTDTFRYLMRWNETEKTAFEDAVVNTEPLLSEGKFVPGTYVIERGAAPARVAEQIVERFNKEILARYTRDVSKVIPLSDTLIIASIIEREAKDFTDMREISGVIWNRIFSEMPLQIDATLQYAKASTYSGAWWPRVLPSDKYIHSPFNTYQNKGLPPAPIANPSIESIVAALNPLRTECVFYFHDRHGRFYCSKTYEDHVSKLRQQYGRGI